MTQTENTMVKILIESRAISLQPDLPQTVRDSVANISGLATEALNGSVRKARTPKAEKKGATASK